MKKLSLFRTVLVALAAAVVAPSIAVAQGGSSLTATPAAATTVQSQAPLAGPRPLQVGVSRAQATAPDLSFDLQRQASRRDVAWMVLGGATLVVGSLVGGDGGTIIMITGGVIGLVGLWRYLQYS